MSHNENSKSVPYIVKLIVGILFMVGGVYLSQNADQYLPFQHGLAEKGIPIDLGITLAVIGVLLIVFPIIQMFYLNPLMNAIGERNSELERTFSEAENLRSEMTRMRNEYEQRIASTEAAAREQIQAQIKEAQQLRQSLMTEATARADEMVRQAQETIEGEKQRVLTQLRLEVVNLTLTATEKVLGENMDSEKNRRLVQDFISKVEVPR
jgi:F-type H+-transporting ATPase subunit b